MRGAAKSFTYRLLASTDDIPSDTMDATEVFVCEFVEGRWGEVEVELGTANAFVDDRHGDALAVDCGTCELLGG